MTCAHRIIFHNEKDQHFPSFACSPTHVDGGLHVLETSAFPIQTLGMAMKNRPPEKEPGHLSEQGLLHFGKIDITLRQRSRRRLSEKENAPQG
jgi:hypothetical protein